MDDAVLRAMAKWPNVPAVYGWMSLDRRGRWRLKGTPLEHRRAIEFINRNYAVDEARRWYFQNGPQRVFVALDAAPFLFTLDGAGELRGHTGVASGAPDAGWMTASGEVFLRTTLGPGLLDHRDLDRLGDTLSTGPDRAPRDAREIDRVEALLESPSRLASEPLWLRHEHPEHGWAVRLGALADADVANTLGFDPHPSDAADAPRH